MRKLIIAAIIGAVAVLATYGATMANGRLSHNVAATDADLSLGKGDSPDPVHVGEHLTYTLVVTNNGPATSTNVTLVDTLPDTVTFVSASATSGTCSESAGVVTCDLDDLSFGKHATSTIVVTPNVAMDITNTAHVHGSENDPDSSDNSASESTSVVASPNQSDLSVEKTGSPNPVPVGGSLTYAVEVVNMGAATSTGVTLEDTLPVEVTFTSATTTSGTCSESGGVVTCHVGTLLPNESATVTIVVVVEHTGDIVNSVEVSADQVDPIPGNNTDEITTSVVYVATDMEIDIRPGSERNPMSLRGRGVLPVAILGGTNFDVHDIDVSTVRFGVDGDDEKPAHRRRGHGKRGHIGDINGDGIDDMMLHFKTRGLGIDCSVERGDAVTLTLTGELEDGTSFGGEDTVTIVGRGHLKKGHGPHCKPDKARGHHAFDGDGEDDGENGNRGKGNSKDKSPKPKDGDDDHPSKGKGKGKGGK